MRDPKPTCPTCTTTGRPVPLTTVRALSVPAPAWDRAFFCQEPTCPVVYFDGVAEHIGKTEVRVVVFHKETDRQGHRPMCRDRNGWRRSPR